MTIGQITNGPTVFRYPSEREVRQLWIGVAVVIVAITVSPYAHNLDRSPGCFLDIGSSRRQSRR